ncbi:hypothetical protein F0224_17670 [Vibrio coralliilyticus]|nr:hypothetical protein [Vibrio coralliilyticus]PAW02558.1 hypothetical protein CKJ79_15165 [Vibrio coralliilyticus]
MKRFSNNKEIQKLVARLIRNGWQCVRGAKHAKLLAPNGKRITVPSTPSDRKAFINFSKDIQRLVRQ